MAKSSAPASRAHRSAALVVVCLVAGCSIRSRCDQGHASRLTSAQMDAPRAPPAMRPGRNRQGAPAPALIIAVCCPAIEMQPSLPSPHQPHTHPYWCTPQHQTDARRPAARPDSHSSPAAQQPPAGPRPRRRRRRRVGTLHGTLLAARPCHAIPLRSGTPSAVALGNLHHHRGTTSTAHLNRGQHD